MSLNQEIKELIIEALQLEEITPEDIKDEEPLFGEGLGLDSIDALELGMAVKRKYNITLGQDKEENKKIFYSVDTISKFVEAATNG
jgi:acyl carrier protein